MIMRMARALAIIGCMATVALGAEHETLNDLYPGVLSGALSTARLGNVPEGVLVQYGQESVTAAEMEDVLSRAPEKLRPQLAKNALFLAQEIATKELLTRAARDAAAKSGVDIAKKSDAALVSEHMQSVVSDISVSDAEVKQFYDENRDMFEGASFKKVERTLIEFVRKQKRQKAADEYVRGLGGAYGAVIGAEWAKRQAEQAMDNPLDKARMSKRPTMVDFGAHGCRACDMMEPVLEALKKKYEGKANILFVHVQEEQVLAARYGIQSIPVQVFCDAEGREVFRHTGFFAQEEIEKKLAELGVK